MLIPIWLLTLHFIADFLCQTDWMATNKSKRWDALALHVTVYTAVVALAANWTTFVQPFGSRAFSASIVTLAWWIGVTWATHFLTDALTSRATSRLWFFEKEVGIWTQPDYAVPKHNRVLINPWSLIEGDRRHWFFVMIGFDQLIHATTLALTWQYLQ